MKRVERALLSVSDKTGIVTFGRGLRALGVDLVSTGGTAATLRGEGVEVVDVAQVTGSPEMMGGRVKSLHPRIHGGILARRDLPEHMAALAEHGIRPIDLVAVNLYPFEATIERPGVSVDAAIEQIDIGGPAMLRAAAKNHDWVAVICNPQRYDDVLEEIQRSGAPSAALRRALAVEAFAHTAAYDQAIARWLGQAPLS